MSIKFSAPVPLQCTAQVKQLALFVVRLVLEELAVLGTNLPDFSLVCRGADAEVIV
jgi:hypothetical protein